MGILSARLGHDLIERGFKAAAANSTLDQERSARTVAFQNQGQICLCGSRVFVEESKFV